MAIFTLNNVSFSGSINTAEAPVAAAGGGGGASLYSYSSPITVSSSRSTSGPNDSTPVSGQSAAEIYGYFNSTSQTGAYDAMVAATYIKIPSAAGYIYFTIPDTGTWRIKAQGGAGGYTNKSTVVGSAVQGDFTLNSGDVLWITIGGAGAYGNAGSSDLAGGAGGGFSVVAKSSSGSSTFSSGDMTALLVAAGGLGQSEGRHGSYAPASSSADGTTGTGFTTSWKGQSINGSGSGFGGQTTYGGFGGGIGTDDGFGGAGGYDSVFSSSPNSYVNPIASNIVRENTGTLMSSFTHGAVRLTKL
jgi:hypothetical protein